VLILVSGANRVDQTAIRDEIGEPLARTDANAVRAHTGFAIGGVAPLLSHPGANSQAGAAGYSGDGPTWRCRVRLAQAIGALRRQPLAVPLPSRRWPAGSAAQATRARVQVGWARTLRVQTQTGDERSNRPRSSRAQVSALV
jgi:hypothetical protein